MRKKIQIAAIALLILLTALAAVTVQLYRRGRKQSDALYRQGNAQANGRIKDYLDNASTALQNMQIYGMNYVLTGQADSLKTSRESLQDWQYESESLDLMSGNGAKAALAHDFSETGNQLANEMNAIISLYEAGSHDAAVDRLRKGAAIADRDKFNKITEVNRRALAPVSNGGFANSVKVSRRLIYCAGGLCGLGFLTLALLFLSLRTTAGITADSGKT